MNTANVAKLIERLEALRDGPPADGIGFNMGDYIGKGEHEDKSGHSCGTTMCMAGHACEIAFGEGAIEQPRDSCDYFSWAKKSGLV